MSCTLFTSLTAANSAPSGATAGVPLRRTSMTTSGFFGAQRGLLLIKNTAGSGTMTCSVKLWGYISAGSNPDVANPASGWYPLGTSTTASSKGLVNEASSMGETGADTIAHAEVIENLGAFDRIYGELAAVAGTATAISAYLLTLPGVDR